MKKYLITYATNEFKDASTRLYDNTIKFKLFDDIIIFTEKELTNEMKSNKIINHSKGAGYWIWKFDIIVQMLNRISQNDIIVYIDAGCYIYNTNEWNKYWNSLKSNDIILFKIPSKIKEWCKKESLNYFQINSSDKILNKYLLAGGFMIIKKTPETVIFFNYLRDLAIKRPYLFTDSNKINEYSYFREHRHDQSILSLAVYKKFDNYKNLKTYWENFEIRSIGQCLYAARSKNIKQKYVPYDIIRQVYHQLIKYPLLSNK